MTENLKKSTLLEMSTRLELAVVQENIPKKADEVWQGFWGLSLRLGSCPN